jgi:hypothetical protein
MNYDNKEFMMFTQNSMPALSEGDNSTNSNFGSAKTPQYLITCKEIFMSEMDQYADDTAPCLMVDFGCARVATYDSSGQQSGDGRFVSKDVRVSMRPGSWNGLIQQNLAEGKRIDTITIKRVMSLNGVLVVIQQTDFMICMFKTYNQSGDVITFTFCYASITDVRTVYDSSGSSLGNVGVTIDYIKTKVEAITS